MHSFFLKKMNDKSFQYLIPVTLYYNPAKTSVYPSTEKTRQKNTLKNAPASPHSSHPASWAIEKKEKRARQNPKNTNTVAIKNAAISHPASWV
jgi:hypothetical protein